MRAIASLTLSFGLVAIPVKLYSATEASAAIRFKLMGPTGARLRQHYVADVDDEPALDIPAAPPPRAPARAARAAAPAPASRAVPPAIEEEPPAPPRFVERQDMVKGYEFEKGHYVVFTPDELKALKAQARDSIDIVGFIPQGAIDPVYYDKAYLLAPDKRGEKTYSLLHAALRESGRSALALWAWRGRQVVVEVRPAEGGLVLQQLFYADEVRSPESLDIPLVEVGAAELKLALQLVEQGARDAYDPAEFVDEEKQRILAAVEQKIAGREIVQHSTRPDKAPASGQVIDLMEALRASLRAPAAGAKPRKAAVGAAKARR